MLWTRMGNKHLMTASGVESCNRWGIGGLLYYQMKSISWRVRSDLAVYKRDLVNKHTLLVKVSPYPYWVWRQGKRKKHCYRLLFGLRYLTFPSVPGSELKDHLNRRAEGSGAQLDRRPPSSG